MLARETKGFREQTNVRFCNGPNDGNRSRVVFDDHLGARAHAGHQRGEVAHSFRFRNADYILSHNVIIHRDSSSLLTPEGGYTSAHDIPLRAMVVFSGLGKIRRIPRIVHGIHEVTGAPLKYFSLLAACELAGALGLVLGIWWPSMEVAARIGLVLYFVGATVSHLRISDVKG